MPVNVGVVFFVMLSIFDRPVSSASIRSGVEGGSGALVSMTRGGVMAVESTPVLPAMSVARAVTS